MAASGPLKTIKLQQYENAYVTARAKCINM